MNTSKWSTMPCTGFDVETTGVDPLEDRIVSAAVVKIRDGQRPKINTWLINPGVEIPQGAIDVHGITNEHAAASGMAPDVALFEITGILARSLGHGVPVVAMNGRFDLTMLEAENRRHQVDTLASRLRSIAPVIDPLVIDKAADRYRKGSRKLVDLCAHYGVKHVGAHDAAGDALAACRLWPRIIAANPEKFRGFTLQALHQAQVGWAREQAVSLAAYFNRIGEHEKAATVSPEWPIQRPPIQTVDPQGALL